MAQSTKQPTTCYTVFTPPDRMVACELSVEKAWWPVSPHDRCRGNVQHRSSLLVSSVGYWDLGSGRIKNHLLQAQERSSQRAGTKARVDKEILTKLKCRNETCKRWKQGQVTWEEYSDTVQACRNADGKAKTHLELDLARDVKGDKKGIYRYISKRKTRENVDLLMNRLGGGMAKDTERAEVVNAILASAFSGVTR